MQIKIPPNLSNKTIWQRILYIILFSIAFSVAKTVLNLAIIIQVIIVLFTGKPHENLKNFGRQLSEYLYQISKYMTFNSDLQPFPFSDWPK